MFNARRDAISLSGMNSKPLNVLLVEDDALDAERIRAAILPAGSSSPIKVSLAWEPRLATGLERLRRNGFDLILLDLSLPDASAIDACDALCRAVPDVPILALAGTNEEDLARQLVERGAQGFLHKNSIDASWLTQLLCNVASHQAMARDVLESQLRLDAIGRASPFGILVLDAQGRCLYSNASYRDIAGLNDTSALASDWNSTIHVNDRDKVGHAQLASLMTREQEVLDTELRFCRNGDATRWARVVAVALHDDGKFFGYAMTVQDISDAMARDAALHEAEEHLFVERERNRIVLNSIADAVMVADPHGKVLYLNSAAEGLTGWPVNEAAGQPLTDVLKIIDGATRQPIANLVATALCEDRIVTIGTDTNAVLIRRDHSEHGIEESVLPLHTRSGSVSEAALIFRDVSEERDMALKMAYRAQHDPLTDLPNRILLQDRLAQAITLAHRHQRKAALLYMDLDNFKSINDSLGHSIGDKLLQVVSGRLLACLRTSDTIARHGGDEFIVLLTEIERAQDAALCAEKMLNALTAPIDINHEQLYASLSIGISIYPDDGSSGEALIRNADTAMYHVKKGGRGNYQFFTPQMNDLAVERQTMEAGLRRAIERSEFLLHYQPKINLENGAITGVEALLRWQHPDGRLIQPAQFVTVAESCGLMPKIGKWVLHAACQQTMEWLLAGLDIQRVAINISAMEFRAKHFVDDVRSTLTETGLPPHCLELEMNEGVLMHDMEASKALLAHLKRVGVNITIDDFGTGYSSLNYLKHYPIDTLKIDQSFIRYMTSDSADAAIVGAIIGMGKCLNYRIVAEGVETLEQQLFLQSRFCDEVQGFHFSRPLSVDEFTTLMEHRMPHQNHTAPFPHFISEEVGLRSELRRGRH